MIFSWRLNFIFILHTLYRAPTLNSRLQFQYFRSHTSKNLSLVQSVEMSGMQQYQLGSSYTKQVHKLLHYCYSQSLLHRVLVALRIAIFLKNFTQRSNNIHPFIIYHHLSYYTWLWGLLGPIPAVIRQRQEAGYNLDKVSAHCTAGEITEREIKQNLNPKGNSSAVEIQYNRKDSTRVNKSDRS